MNNNLPVIGTERSAILYDTVQYVTTYDGRGIKMGARDGTGAPIIFLAVFTMCGSVFWHEIEASLNFLGQQCSIIRPGEVLNVVHSKELGAAHPLHNSTIDGQRSMV